MAKAHRPILFDADAFICLLEWNVFGKVRKSLGASACVAEYVIRKEIKGHRDRTTKRWIPFNCARINRESVPRLVTKDDLSGKQYEEYLQHFQSLVVADPGERETFALAWVLGYDVCSRDTDARSVFYEYRPEGCSSKHMDVMDLLRRLELVP